MAKTIKIDHVAKIEGHAELSIKIENGKLKQSRFKVIEGARFFEQIIVGRNYDEVPYMTSRICGVCSPIHVVTSCMAVENAFNVKITKQSKLLRELLVHGGNIQSHAMHLYFLALPDYLGFESAIPMMSKYKKEINNALLLKRLGNKIIQVIGGREVHPITCIPGGFAKTPDQNKLKEILIELKAAKKVVKATAKLFQSLKYPDFEMNTEYFALEGKNNYPSFGSKVASHKKDNFSTKSYEEHIAEYLSPGEPTKFAVSKGEGYFVGALARLNINHKLLSKDAQKAIKIKLPNNSIFMNNVAQAIELIDAVDRCITIIGNLKLKEEKSVEIKTFATRGIAITEAPRGLLIHDYKFNKDGKLLKANVITPTSQNLRNINDEIKAFLPSILSKPKKEITVDIEKLIRSYDPCISCSAQFLIVNWEGE
jgi:sulfhydrogenase subunit alpha